MQGCIFFFCVTVFTKLLQNWWEYIAFGLIKLSVSYELHFVPLLGAAKSPPLKKTTTKKKQQKTKYSQSSLQ